MFRIAVGTLLTLTFVTQFGFAQEKPPEKLPAFKPTSKITWQGWSDSIFEKSKKENKLVILDLEAVWCHWCHVMDEKTYSDPRVIDLINSKYMAVRVDQDSRPDLSNRYEDFGWPATIVFSPTGQELVKRAGNITPDQMVSMLDAVVKDPTPGPSVTSKPEIKYSTSAALSSDLRTELLKSLQDNYDHKLGAWKVNNKFMDSNLVDYLIVKAQSGDKSAEKMAKQTLNAQKALIDPVWGGVYQYSVEGDWKHPHFEKIMSIQADNMRVYAQAYAAFKDASYLKSANDIEKYLKAFLTSADGAFYTSQDADIVQGQHSEKYFKLGDDARRKQGVPRVDQHIYARENGWMIRSLVAMYSVTGDKQYLDSALKAADWVITNRKIDGGGFHHDKTDSAGPFLGDSVAMGIAEMSLYSATGDRQWLKQAGETLDYIQKNFKGAKTGFITEKWRKNSVFEAVPQVDENLLVARFANMMFHYTGNKEYKKSADVAMSFLVTPAIAQETFSIAPVLILDNELAKAPIHITVVGHKDDPVAQELIRAALKYPSFYKRVDWLDKREGDLPNTDTQYPEMKTAAAFACAKERCSLPAYNADDIKKRVDSLLGI